MPPTARSLRPARGQKSFLANLGTLAEFTTRATFAKNFFEAGGIEVVTNEEFPSASHVPIRAMRWSLPPSRIPAQGLRACAHRTRRTKARPFEAAEALNAASRWHIYLAGRPGEREAAYRDAGVQTFIFAGCDVLAMLQAAHRLIAR